MDYSHIALKHKLRLSPNLILYFFKQWILQLTQWNKYRNSRFEFKLLISYFLPNHACWSPCTSMARPKSASFTAAPFILLARSRFSGCNTQRRAVVQDETFSLMLQWVTAFDIPPLISLFLPNLKHTDKCPSQVLQNIKSQSQDGTGC